jgi:uncharacterized protein
MNHIALDNPFVVTGYFGPEYFCDRKEETENLISSLKNGWNVTLISPRRLGKTGLIHHAFDEISSTTDIRCFYVDIYSTKNLSDFVQALANAIVGKLDSPLEKAVKTVGQVFSAFRPTMSLDGQTGEPTFSFDITPQQSQASLESIFKYLNDSGKQCYVAIDEFQQIMEYPEKGVEAMIRSYVQFMPYVRFIFAGSRQHMMQEMFLSASHPFYRSTQIVSLQEIDEKKYLSFANGFFNKQNRSISENDFHQLYASVDGQTFFVQAILNKLYSHPTKMIDSDFIHYCMWEAIDEQVPAFQYIYNTLSENQALLLRAIARDRRVSEPLGKDFIQKHPLPSKSSIKLALDFLVDRQLVYHDLQRKYYIVYDRFMAMWLRK